MMKVTKITIEIGIETVNDLINAFDSGVIDFINIENRKHAIALGKLEDVLRPHKTVKKKEEEL